MIRAANWSKLGPTTPPGAWIVLALDLALLGLGIATGMWLLIIPMALAALGQVRLLWRYRVAQS